MCVYAYIHTAQCTNSQMKHINQLTNDLIRFDPTRVPSSVQTKRYEITDLKRTAKRTYRVRHVTRYVLLRAIQRSRRKHFALSVCSSCSLSPLSHTSGTGFSIRRLAPATTHSRGLNPLPLARSGNVIQKQSSFARVNQRVLSPMIDLVIKKSIHYVC